MVLFGDDQHTGVKITRKQDRFPQPPCG